MSTKEAIPWDLYDEWAKDKPPIDANGKETVSKVVSRLLMSKWLAARDERIRADGWCLGWEACRERAGLRPDLRPHGSGFPE
jgi:hypothetical protein